MGAHRENQRKGARHPSKTSRVAGTGAAAPVVRSRAKSALRRGGRRPPYVVDENGRELPAAAYVPELGDLLIGAPERA